MFQAEYGHVSGPKPRLSCTEKEAMLLKQWDMHLPESMEPAALCRFIEKDCQPGITHSCKKIQAFFLNQSTENISLETSVLVQLLFSKLQDEVKHVFLKEKGIVFPLIKKAREGFALDEKIRESIYSAQKLMVNLLLKLRQLLDNYLLKPGSGKEWRSCVNELFLLENKIHQWIYIEQNLLYPAIIKSNSCQ